MSSFPSQTSKPNFTTIFESVHTYWSDNHIFEQSVAERSDENQFRFYDGPPFVTGLPHYGHLASSVAKDVIPRYQTMKGKKVDRVRGWDCHGIPIEQKVQKKLGLESNLDIEKVGIETFINECYNYTRSTSSEWKRYIDQFARRVDFDNSYKTMNNDYMESVRRVFKTLWDKGLIYKGKRVSLYSTKLETPISNFEVAMDDTYEEVNDPAITVMLELTQTPAEGDSRQAGKYEYTSDGYLRYVLGVIRDPQGAYLMVKNTKRGGKRQCPGGKIDAGETAEQALAREIYEELGVGCTIGKHIMNKKVFANGLRQAEYYEVMLDGIPTIQEPYKHEKLERVSMHKKDNVYTLHAETETIEHFNPSVDEHYDIIHLACGRVDITKIYLLVRTTTPWTIPVNIAAGVHKEIQYVLVAYQGSGYIVAKNRLEAVFAGKEYEIIRHMMGSELVGLSYKPPFDYLYGKTANDKDHKIYHADFVSDADGTGLVHEAPEFGEVDFQLAKQVGLTITEAMDSAGYMSYLIPTSQTSPSFPLLSERDDHMTLSNGKVGIGKEPSLKGEGGAAGGGSVLASPIFYRDANPIVIQELHDMGRLFHKASITHRVAFCPRSGTPLVYKAQDSWFIDINGKQAIFNGKSLKEMCIEANEQINRYPAHNKHGRFLKSLESAPDRCISRTRYWGTPMPIYRAVGADFGSARTDDVMVIGSREELFQLSKNGSKNLTKIILVRHGFASHNVTGSKETHASSSLMPLGQEQAQKLVTMFNNEKIDAIYSSPKQRTLDTIQPLADQKGVSIITDDLLLERKKGGNESMSFLSMRRDDLTVSEDNERPQQLFNRVKIFLDRILSQHAGETIVICSHYFPLAMMAKYLHDYNFDTSLQNYLIHNETLEDYMPKTFYRNTTRNAELDLHRPFIDDVWFEKDGVRYERISEVLDCWVESASMPYAQVHYPFENKEKFEKSFPADYIVEYTGQIRAWFYVMHVLGVALFGKPAFTNVICHGVIAGNDGRKMSKSLGNFPDPKPTFEQYGGDAVRMSILTTSLFNGGDMAFSEELIKEALKQNVLPLWNAFYFFTTYANIDGWKQTHPILPGQGGEINLLDQRILSELSSLAQTIDTDLQNYDLTHSSRQIALFLENLTNWYIRRSRRRFWKSENDGDKNAAYQTLYTVLVKFCTIAAPFMPIVTEYIYRALTNMTGSVHLQSFPQVGVDYQSTRTNQSTGDLSDSFTQAQTIVRAGLAARSKRSIRVRQPLASLKLGIQLDPYFADLIADELNIKQVIYDPSLNDKVMKICKPDGKAIGAKFGGNTKDIFALAKSGQFVEHPDGSVAVGEWLLDPGTFEISYIKNNESDSVEVEEGIVMEIDREITPALAREGYARDLIRQIQDARKEADYDIADRIQIQLSGDLASTSFIEDIINHHGATIQEETLSTIIYTMSTPDLTKSLEIDKKNVSLALKR